MAYASESGEDVSYITSVNSEVVPAVLKWHEVNSTDQIKRLKKENIGKAVKIILDEISLREGSDEFGKTLESLMKEADDQGATTTLFGDIDSNTVLFAHIHCISDAYNTITVTYVVNTLSSNLPRKEIRKKIRTVRLDSDERRSQLASWARGLEGLSQENIETVERSEDELQMLLFPPPHSDRTSRFGRVQTALGWITSLLCAATWIPSRLAWVARFLLQPKRAASQPNPNPANPRPNVKDVSSYKVGGVGTELENGLILTDSKNSGLATDSSEKLTNTLNIASELNTTDELKKENANGAARTFDCNIDKNCVLGAADQDIERASGNTDMENREDNVSMPIDISTANSQKDNLSFLHGEWTKL